MHVYYTTTDIKTHKEGPKHMMSLYSTKNKTKKVCIILSLCKMPIVSACTTLHHRLSLQQSHAPTACDNNCALTACDTTKFYLSVVQNLQNLHKVLCKILSTFSKVCNVEISVLFVHYLGDLNVLAPIIVL